MKKLWSLIVFFLAVFWILPLPMMLFGEFVPMKNVSSSDFWYVFWYAPAEAAKQQDWVGYLPTLFWFGIIWVVGMAIILLIQKFRRRHPNDRLQ